MDQTTHQVRMANWQKIIQKCQDRPKEQSAKAWLAENSIPEKQYYYWLRKLRKLAYADSSALLPAVSSTQASTVAFAEFPAKDVIPDEAPPAVTIKTTKATVEISSAIPEALMIKLVKAVAHAL